MRMRLGILLPVLVSPLFLLSCSNSQSPVVTYTDSSTVRNAVAGMESATVWSREIEGNRLSASIDRNPLVDSGIQLEPAVLNVIPPSDGPVYPSLDGFGELDVSSLDAAASAVADSFCSALAAWDTGKIAGLIADDCKFTSVFFLSDLESGWKVHFGTEFPVVRDISGENPPVSQVFSSWIKGKPEPGNGILRIPARLYGKDGHADVSLYLDCGNEYKICRIAIDGWENLYGEK